MADIIIVDNSALLKDSIEALYGERYSIILTNTSEGGLISAASHAEDQARKEKVFDVIKTGKGWDNLRQSDPLTKDKVALYAFNPELLSEEGELEYTYHAQTVLGYIGSDAKVRKILQSSESEESFTLVESISREAEKNRNDLEKLLGPASH